MLVLYFSLNTAQTRTVAKSKWQSNCRRFERNHRMA